jgi:glycosyltransferase involved in cell wall biosynthesis
MLKSKPLRLALVASEHTLTEHMMFFEHLLLGLADESIPVIALCPAHCAVDSMLYGAVEIIKYSPSDPPLAGRITRELLADRLGKFRPDLLHCLCETKASLTRKLAHYLNLPYVLTVNSLPKRLRPLSISPRRCTKIVVPTETLATALTKMYPRLADRLQRVNVGTFVSSNVCCFDQPGLLPVLTVAHSLDVADHFENLLHALRHLVLDRYEFAAVIMGQGRAESQIRKLVSSLDLVQVVTIVPIVRPFRSILAAGDIFIQLLARSAFNPFLLEAMSVGAAVASGNNGVDELVIKDRTAVLFDPADELSIVQALRQLLDNHQFARQIAEQAQQYLHENHSISGMMTTLLKIYNDARRSSNL